MTLWDSKSQSSDTESNALLIYCSMGDMLNEGRDLLHSLLTYCTGTSDAIAVTGYQTGDQIAVFRGFLVGRDCSLKNVTCEPRPFFNKGS